MVQSGMDISIILKVNFFKSENGNEPAREWLRDLHIDDKKRIGEDIKTVQFSWPLGMPIVRKLNPDLWEVRSKINSGIARIFFTIINDNMIILHGFIKKSQKTPKKEMEIALKRKKIIYGRNKNE